MRVTNNRWHIINVNGPSFEKWIKKMEDHAEVSSRPNLQLFHTKAENLEFHFM
jgi:hypothetical protein